MEQRVGRRRGRGGRAAFYVAGLCALPILSITACSLLVPLDGASSGGPGGDDASADRGDGGGGLGDTSLTPSKLDGSDDDADAFSSADSGADAKPAELPNLIGYWSFEEGTGNVTADQSGHSPSHDMVLINGPLWINGNMGKGIHLNGSTTTMRVDALYQEKFPASGTFSFWFNAEANSEWILDHYDTSRDHIYIRILEPFDGNPLRINAVLAVGTPDAAGIIAFAAATPVSHGAWTHAVVVWDTAAATRSAAFYVNGVLVKTDKLPLNWKPSEQEFNLGQKGCCGGFIGGLDEIRLYDRALPPDDVAKVP